MSYQTGWVRDPQAVQQTLDAIEAQGQSPLFTVVGQALLTADDDSPVFFWDAEAKVLGQILPSFDQGNVGSCVGNAYARASQDLVLWQVASGAVERWPGAGVAVEPIYGGSRVEVGGGRINGDGSVGAWAAKWVRDYGILLRQHYGDIDLTTYSVQRCREWGRSGVPDSLEPVAREHPVTAVAQTRTGEECWAAVGGGKPVVVCSDQGFTTRHDSDGFCSPQGQWMHAMLVRGRFVHPRRGRSFVIQNSWGGYLGGRGSVEAQGRGRVELPEGCFAAEFRTVDRMMRQMDSFALAGLRGWVAERIDHAP